MIDGPFTTENPWRAGAGELKRLRLPAMSRPMSQPRRYTQAAGSVLAIAIIVGAVAGVIVGQPSIGFLVGLGAGVLIAILFWLNDRRRP
jgi:uncharacterized membrane protein